MHINRLTIKNFRCFTDFAIDLSAPIILIEGANGSGKTSLLEAIHYACYLRSFRTHSPRDLITFGQDTFFIKAAFSDGALDEEHELHIGFSGKKRLVKLNQKAVASYKELLDFYRVVTLTEEDMALVQGSPQERRSFIDQAIMLYNPAFMHTLRTLRHIVDQRTHLLSRSIGPSDHESYLLWTQQLWEKSQMVQQERVAALAGIEQETNRMIAAAIDENLHIAFTYCSKRGPLYDSCDEFLAANPTLLDDEQRMHYCQFGAHVDDILITFNAKKSRVFASRGQQKLIVTLVKIAQMSELMKKRGPALFIFDDFMADFDEFYLQKILSIALSLKTQLIFTSPIRDGKLSAILQNYGALKVELPH